MQMFRQFKINIESQRVAKMIAHHFSANSRGRDIKEHGVLGIVEDCEKIKIPFDQLNDVVGLKLLEMVQICNFSKNSCNVLAHFLKHGLVLTQNHVQYIGSQKFQNRMRRVLTDFDSWDPPNKKTINTNLVINFFDLMTTFGAKWDAPSDQDRQYPTVLDYMYHKSKHTPVIKNYVKRFYVDRDPQRKMILDSKQVIRHRMKQMFADDQNDIVIETGERVIVNAVPKHRSAV